MSVIKSTHDSRLSIQNAYNYMSLRMPNGRFTFSYSGAKGSGGLVDDEPSFRRLIAYMDGPRPKGQTNGERMQTLLDPAVLTPLYPNWAGDATTQKQVEIPTPHPNQLHIDRVEAAAAAMEKKEKSASKNTTDNTKTLTRNEFYARYANASFTRNPNKNTDVWTHFDAKNNLEVTIFGMNPTGEPRKTTFRGIIKSYKNSTVKVYVSKYDGSGPRPTVYFKDHETK